MSADAEIILWHVAKQTIRHLQLQFQVYKKYYVHFGNNLLFLEVRSMKSAIVSRIWLATQEGDLEKSCGTKCNSHRFNTYNATLHVFFLSDYY